MTLGYSNLAAGIAPSGGLAWGIGLWPFGGWACAAGVVGGAVGGLIGAWPLAWLEERAAAAGGRWRWAAVVATLVALWLALVIVPSVIGGVARNRHRPEPEPNPPWPWQGGVVDRREGGPWQAACGRRTWRG